MSLLERGLKDATSDRLERLLLPLGYRLVALPTRLGTAAMAAAEVRESVAGGDQQGALREVWQLATDLRRADPALRVALAVSPPAATGDARFDALVAGVVEQLLAGDSLPRPVWLDEHWRSLEVPWDVEPVASLRAAARRRTPPGLQAHGVYLDAAELVDA